MPKQVELYNSETGEKITRNSVDAREILAISRRSGGHWSLKKGQLPERSDDIADEVAAAASAPAKRGPGRPPKPRAEEHAA